MRFQFSLLVLFIAMTFIALALGVIRNEVLLVIAAPLPVSLCTSYIVVGVVAALLRDVKAAASSKSWQPLHDWANLSTNFWLMLLCAFCCCATFLIPMGSALLSNPSNRPAWNWLFVAGTASGSMIALLNVFYETEDKWR